MSAEKSEGLSVLARVNKVVDALDAGVLPVDLGDFVGINNIANDEEFDLVWDALWGSSLYSEGHSINAIKNPRTGTYIILIPK
jgi:hypothetical protein